MLMVSHGKSAICIWDTDVIKVNINCNSLALYSLHIFKDLLLKLAWLINVVHNCNCK